MSQESNITPVKRPRHSSRAQRSRPVLVTGNGFAEEQSTTAVESQPEIAPAVSAVEPTPKRRLPNFFSTIGKSDKETIDLKPEVDQAQARLARATRTNKSVSQSRKEVVSKEVPSERAKEATKPVAAKTSTPARPASVFKTRHIIGIAIYLVAANFLGYGITLALNSIHANVLLTTLNLFGNKIAINTSLLAFLGTLVIILILLAKFDFIPRSLGGSTATRTTGKGSNSISKTSTDGPRTPPPVVRPGVKGSDDKLYETYRLNQRRDKKR